MKLIMSLAVSVLGLSVLPAKAENITPPPPWLSK